MDLGGISDVEIVEYPLLHPKVFFHLGIDPPRGIILRVHPGCDKTHLSNSLAGELWDMAYYFRVSAPNIITRFLGDSEWRIRNLFQSAAKNAPSMVFINNIDAVSPKRGEGVGGLGGGARTSPTP